MMVPNLLKRFVLSTFGAVGMGTSAPIIYEGASFPYRETAWWRYLNWDGSLGTCIFRGNGIYLVDLYLSVSEKRFADRGKGISTYIIGEKIPRSKESGTWIDKKHSTNWKLKGELKGMKWQH